MGRLSNPSPSQASPIAKRSTPKKTIPRQSFEINIRAGLELGLKAELSHLILLSGLSSDVMLLTHIEIDEKK